VRKPLTILFFSTLLVVVDVRINGFDLLPDLVGAAGVVAGTHLLAGGSGDAVYRARVGVARAVALLALAGTIAGGLAWGLGPVGRVFRFAEVATPLAVTAALLRLAEVAGAPDVLRTARRAFGWLVAAVAGALVLDVTGSPVLRVVVAVSGLAAIVLYFVLLLAARDLGSPVSPPAGPAWVVPGRAVAVLLFVALLAGGGSAVTRARAQNFWRPVDPYRASAVRAGLPDWPIRGNRVHDRSWMHGHLYCCVASERMRVLYAGETPYGPLSLVEAPPEDGQPGPSLYILAGSTGMRGYDLDLAARPEQISVIVPMSQPDGATEMVLLVVGRPGTTRIGWRPAGAGRGAVAELPVRDGAAFTPLPWGTGESPNDVVVSVGRPGGATYESTVTSLAAVGLERTGEAPAPLVPLPAALAATAGERADSVAFRYCLVRAYGDLPRLLADPAAATDPAHRPGLQESIASLAADRAVRAAGASGVRAALAAPGSPTARVVTAACAAYDAMGEWPPARSR
jgi:hypothetical protein